MKLIGYWMRDLRDMQLPLPQELVGDMPAHIRSGVCDYLVSGEVFETYRGASWCRFRCGAEDRRMGSRELTDGEWVWPDGLVHYVQAHNVVLPEEFVISAMSGRSPVRPIEDTFVSLDFWVDWAKQKQSPHIRLRLAGALAAARAAEPGVIEHLVQEVLVREAEGSERCVVSACSRPALVGRRICARHLLGDHGIGMGTQDLYRLPNEIFG